MTHEDELARRLFDFEHADDDLEPSDIVIGLGSHDVHVAERAAEIFRQGLAPYVLFTGGYGRITKNIWQVGEARRFAEVAARQGVPQEAILVEDEASNTGENITFSKRLLASRGIACRSIIFVDRPYRERRTKAALEVQWPGDGHLITSPQLSYDDYAAYYGAPGAPIDKHEFISLMVGDIQRNIVYGQRGFQAPMEIPQDVLDAYDELVGLGFTQHLMKEG